MFLKIKKIPKTSWSSHSSLSFRPKLKTFIFLCLGLIIFGFGSSLLIHASIGNAPWVVFAQGLSIQFNWSIGFATFVSSIIVLSIWIPLAQKPGLGTVMNMIIIALILDFSIYQFDFSSNIIFTNLFTAFVGTLAAGLGSGIYLIANLGPGPRDGLMTGIQRKTNLPIAAVRAFLEITVVSIGWYLGGTVGIGTLLFAFGIGPAVALGLFLVAKTFS